MGEALGKGDGQYLEEAKDVRFTPKTGRYACSEWLTSGGSYGPYGYISDAMLVLQERDGNNHPTVSYSRSLDLSGSPQVAGGVGGLEAITPGSAVAQFPACDGNGNVMGLIDCATTNWVARYEYGPFGELFCASGPMAKANPFRFSTNYQDDETGFLQYGYRDYSPSTGRCLSRDPIDEMSCRRRYIASTTPQV